MLVIVVSAVLSALIGQWVNPGMPPNTFWENYYYSGAVSAGAPHALACLWGELVVKVYDTLATAAVVCVCYMVTPRRFRQGIAG